MNKNDCHIGTASTEPPLVLQALEWPAAARAIIPGQAAGPQANQHSPRIQATITGGLANQGSLGGP